MERLENLCCLSCGATDLEKVWDRVDENASPRSISGLSR